MEAFSTFLAICQGNSPVPGEFPAQRPVTRSFGVFFDLRLNKRSSKQSWGWWIETPSRPFWRHYNEANIWTKCLEYWSIQSWPHAVDSFTYVGTSSKARSPQFHRVVSSETNYDFSKSWRESMHYNDVIMGAMASQITSHTIVYSTVIQAQIRKHQSCVSLAFAGNSPVTGEFPAQMTSDAGIRCFLLNIIMANLYCKLSQASLKECCTDIQTGLLKCLHYFII